MTIILFILLQLPKEVKNVLEILNCFVIYCLKDKHFSSIYRYINFVYVLI